MIEVQPRIDLSDSDTFELENDTSTSNGKVNEESAEIVQPRRVCRNGKL